MKTLTSAIGNSQKVADDAMIRRLREHFRTYKEGGFGSDYWNVVIARLAELIENQHDSKRLLETVENAQKLAMKQTEFAQSVVHSIQRAMAERESRSQLNNGHAEAEEPAVDLQGE